MKRVRVLRDRWRVRSSRVPLWRLPRWPGSDLPGRAGPRPPRGAPGDVDASGTAPRDRRFSLRRRRRSFIRHRSRTVRAGRRHYRRRGVEAAACARASSRALLPPLPPLSAPRGGCAHVHARPSSGDLAAVLTTRRLRGQSATASSATARSGATETPSARGPVIPAAAGGKAR